MECTEKAKLNTAGAVDTTPRHRNPLILEIKGNSLDDGPGIRSVVFFKGCPLSCRWCHNPESKSTGPGISHDAAECIDCGACVKACPERAISKKNRYFIDRDKCTLCYSCVATCPSGALSQVGNAMTVDDIIEVVSKDIPFYNTSGGGVTLSGGEPTMHMEFTAQLARSLKELNVHLLIETCGLFVYEKYMDLLAPFIDMIYFDIKLFDPVEHKKHCDADNTIILENFGRLHKDYQTGGTYILPRTPLIPGITDTRDNLTAIADYLSSLGVTKAALLEYNPLWGVKCEKIGEENPLGPEAQGRKWMDRDHVEQCRSIFRDRGIEV